jgi:hypothetical protein
MTQKFKEQILNFRNLKLWNQILDLIITENLKDIWFQVYEGESLHHLFRKEESKKVLENVIKISDKQNRDHMFLIGKCYFIFGDETNFLYWYEKAAELNDKSAQNNLGSFYVIFIHRSQRKIKKNLRNLFIGSKDQQS